MTKNENSGNDPQVIIDYLPLMEDNDPIYFNWWALQRSMNSVLSVDDYDELRDF